MLRNFFTRWRKPGVSTPLPPTIPAPPPSEFAHAAELTRDHVAARIGDKIKTAKDAELRKRTAAEALERQRLAMLDIDARFLHGVAPLAARQLATLFLERFEGESENQVLRYGQLDLMDSDVFPWAKSLRDTIRPAPAARLRVYVEFWRKVALELEELGLTLLGNDMVATGNAPIEGQIGRFLFIGIADRPLESYQFYSTHQRPYTFIPGRRWRYLDEENPGNAGPVVAILPAAAGPGPAAG